MKPNKYTFIALVMLFAALQTTAQLANWTVGSNPAFINFPVNQSPQIHGYCRISQLKFHHTNPNKLYVVTPQGGFFTSDDAGNNWTVKSGTENIVSTCASLCIDYTNDQVIYLGTGDPNYYTDGEGMYKSTNGGISFTPTTLTNCLVDDIVQNPTNPAVLIASTNKGIYKSINSGATWAATTAINIPFCDLKQNTGLNSQVLYASTQEAAPRFYRSVDFGSNWSQVTTGITYPVDHIQSGSRIGVTAANPNAVYFEVIGGGGMIHKSTDGGITFTVKRGESDGSVGNPSLTGYDGLNDFSGQGNYNNTITVDATNESKLYLQAHCTWVSTDDGASWTKLTGWFEQVHTDMHQIGQSPFDANKLYSANDGGIWLSTDGGNTWTPKSNGLYAYEVGSNAGKSSHTNRDYTIIGTQDNGKIYRNATGWYCIQGGDDYEIKEYDYLPGGGYIYNFDNSDRTVAPGGATDGFGLPSTGKINAVAFNRTNSETGFIARGQIYRTTNLSATTPAWTAISTFATSDAPIRAIHSCIADLNRLYVITNDNNTEEGKFYVSTNALGGTPTFTSYVLPSPVASFSNASITAIANNANTVYISIDTKVYVSTNSGASWTDITYNLPDVNHRRILAEEYGGTEQLVFIATNNAVYYKKAGQTTWTNYSSNLPARRAPSDFSIYDDGTSQSVIRYASFGRGMWETSFANLRAGAVLPVQLLNFTATNTNNVTGLLNWKTAQEIELSRYEIERSSDAANFIKIGTVAATGLSDYTFSDIAPMNGHNYYRLKMVDIDGKFKYSPVRNLLFTSDVIVTIQPNPTIDGRFTVQVDGVINKKINVAVTNAVGQLVKSTGFVAYAGAVEITLPAGPGLYTVNVTLTDGTVISRKIISLK